MRKSLLARAIMLICSLAAMAVTPSVTNGRTMSGFKFKAEQPKTVLPQSNIISFQDLTPQVEKDLLTRKGIQVTHNFNGETIENGNITLVKAPMCVDEETYTLTVNLKYDKNDFGRVEGVAYPNYTSAYWFYNEWPEDEYPEMLEFRVPTGNYDVEVQINTMSGNFILLTASEVNVIGDTEITLNSEDATVDILWKPLMPDGSIPSADVPVFDPDTYTVTDYVSGNVLSVRNSLTFYNKKHNMGGSLVFNPMSEIIGETRFDYYIGNIKTNPNDNYAFYYVRYAISLEGGYVIPLFADALQSKEVTNKINDYTMFEPEYAMTPYQPEPQIWGEGEDQTVFEFEKNKSFCLNFASIQNGILSSLTGTTLTTSGDPIQQNIHVCQDATLIDEYQVMPIPAFMEDWNSYYKMSGLPINSCFAASIALAINNSSTFNQYLNLPNKRDIFMNEAANPWLSFDITTPHVWNYGCPTLVFTSKVFDWGNSFDFAYVGRLGENRGTDLLSTVAKVSINNAAPSDEILEYLQWGQLPEEGMIDFEFIDTNVAIGGILGKNITHVGFDMSRTDWCPPTLQIVRFVDTAENFTDCYATGEEGVIEFYGGDFKYNRNPETYASWYTEEPATEVKVEYAPYGTEEFLPLEVENVPEKDFMPGFGTYYRGSLAAVDRKSENGWFDVRITLTDASGNYQEQTLSPAFKIDSCVGVETMAYPEIIVSVANGNIMVLGCENPVIEVCSPDGVRLYRVNGESVNASQFGHGIYLVNVIDGTKRVMRKVIL